MCSCTQRSPTYIAISILSETQCLVYVLIEADLDTQVDARVDALTLIGAYLSIRFKS